MSMRLLPLSLAITTIFCSTAHAQSLVQIHDAAEKFDASYQAAKAQYEASKYKAEQAYALNRPAVDLQGSAGKTQLDSLSSSSSNSSTSSGAIFDSSTTKSDSKTDSTDKRVALNLRQNLFNKSNNLAIEQAEISLKVEEENLKAAQQDLMIRVSQAYFDVLSYEENLRFASAQKSAIAEQLAAAKRKFEVGTATIVDTKLAQASFDSVVAQEIKAKSDLLVKYKNLEGVSGLINIKPWRVSNTSSLGFTREDESWWVQNAIEKNPQISAFKYALDIAKLELDKAKAGHLPTASLTASVTRANPTGQTTTNNTTDYTTRLGLPSNLSLSNVSTSIPGNSTNKFIGVVVNVPLFSGFATENRVKETVSLEEKARNALEATQRNIVLATRAAYYDVQAGLSQTIAYEAAEASRNSALESTKLGYQVGVNTSLEVLDSQSQLYQTKRDLAKARYDVLVGQLKLRQAAGVLKTEDLQTVNGLLAP